MYIHAMSAGFVRRISLPTRREEVRALFRNAILEAAESVFAEKGFHAARIQDIAARARIAVGTVYNHFAQKEDMLAALLEERTEEMLDQLAPSTLDPRAFEARLTARIGRMLRYVEQHRPFFAIAAEHGLLGTSSASATSALAGKRLRKVERFRERFGALVAEGVAEQVLEPMDGDILVRFLGGALRAFLLSALHEPRPDVEGEASVIVDLFLHGAARRKTRRRTP
jgi:AcrR family transcriptional regulator